MPDMSSCENEESGLLRSDNRRFREVGSARLRRFFSGWIFARWLEYAPAEVQSCGHHWHRVLYQFMLFHRASCVNNVARLDVVYLVASLIRRASSHYQRHLNKGIVIHFAGMCRIRWMHPDTACLRLFQLEDRHDIIILSWKWQYPELLRADNLIWMLASPYWYLIREVTDLWVVDICWYLYESGVGT